MKPTMHILRVGTAKTAFQKCLQAIANKRLVSRIWQKDLSLWPSYDSRKEAGANSLNWLDLAAGLPAAITQIGALAEKLSADGLQDAVFVGISTCSKAAELVQTLGLPTRGVRFHVLNQIQPLAIRALEQQLDFRRTLFLIASKTGKNLEMHVPLLYFLSKVKAAGVASPGANFVAATEDGSYLSVLAAENRFQKILTEPHGFRGRYSGVQHFGLLLGGLCGLDAGKIVTHLETARRDCARTERLDENPAAKIAAFLVATAQQGHQRLIFRASETLLPLAKRLAHLIGCSTCKNDTGILPFLGVHAASQEILRNKCSVCDITMQGEPPPEPLDPSIPVLSVAIADVEAIPSMVFEWEVATALACSLLDVNPFQDPEDREGRDDAMRYVEQFAVRRQFSVAQPRIVARNISLFVEGDLRHDISSLSLEHALASVFALCAPDGYCVLMNYLWHLPQVNDALAACAKGVSLELAVPASVVVGPRYLHLLGQCYKAGPRGGIALLLTCDSAERIEIPGAGYAFADLMMALALGDFDAMNRRGRPIARLHLAGNPDEAVAELQALLERALKLHSRSH